MAKRLPYYPMYVDSFDEDEKVLPMSLSEVGLYILALNESWKRGSIPDDPDRLAVLIRRSPSSVRKAWIVVRPCWQESEPGRLVNPRQEIEREKAKVKSEKASRSVRTRYEPSTNVYTNEPTRVAIRASESISVSDSSEVIPEKKEKTSTRTRGENDPRSEWFVEFWNLYWRKIAKKTAFTSYLQHVTTEDLRCAVRAAVIGQRPAMLSKEEHLRPHAATWINGHRWEDEIEVAHVNGVRKSRIDTLFDELAADREAGA